MMDHTYDPDPKTGQCRACPPRGDRGCLWCSHPTDHHTGAVPREVLAHYEATGTDGKTYQMVRWTPTACSHPHCACRKYEVRSRS